MGPFLFNFVLSGAPQCFCSTLHYFIFKANLDKHCSKFRRPLGGIQTIFFRDFLLEFRASPRRCRISVHCLPSFLTLSFQLWAHPLPPHRQIQPSLLCSSLPSLAGWRLPSSSLLAHLPLHPPPPPSPLPSPPHPLQQALQHHTSSLPLHTWSWPPWQAPRTSPSPPSQCSPTSAREVLQSRQSLGPGFLPSLRLCGHS